MAKNIGNIYAELSVRDKMTVGLKRAQKSLVSFGKSGLQAGSVAAGALAAGMAIGTKGALELVDSVGDLSAQTGIAVADMMVLQRAYQDGGSDASRAGKDIARMQKTLSEAASGGADPFKALGLSVDRLMSQSPAKQMEMIGEAIMKIENPAQRTAAAMDIFGKSGSKLLSVFGTFEAARVSLGRMPVIAQLFAKEMGEANDIIGRLGGKADAFFVGFTSGIMNELLPALQKVDEFDFTNLGQSMGRGMLDVINEANGFAQDLKDIGGITPSGSIVNSIIDAVTKSITGNVRAAAANAPQNTRVNLDDRQAAFIANQSQPAKEGFLGFKPTQDQLDKHAEYLKKKNKDDEEFRLKSKQSYDEQLQAMEQHNADKLAEDQRQTNILIQAELDRAMESADQWGGGRNPISAGFNEMQSRGFGMGAMDVPMKVDKQVELLEQIRDELKKKIKAEQLKFS